MHSMCLNKTVSFSEEWANFLICKTTTTPALLYTNSVALEDTLRLWNAFWLTNDVWRLDVDMSGAPYQVYQQRIIEGLALEGYIAHTTNICDRWL